MIINDVNNVLYFLEIYKAIMMLKRNNVPYCIEFYPVLEYEDEYEAGQIEYPVPDCAIFIPHTSWYICIGSSSFYASCNKSSGEFLVSKENNTPWSLDLRVHADQSAEDACLWLQERYRELLDEQSNELFQKLLDDQKKMISSLNPIEMARRISQLATTNQKTLLGLFR